MRRLFFLFALLWGGVAFGQSTQVASGPAEPATCDPTIGQLFFNNSTIPGVMKYCSAVNTWAAVGGTGTGSTLFPWTTLASTTTPSLTVNNGSANYFMSVTGDISSVVTAGAAPNGTYIGILFKEDGTGGHAIPTSAFPGNFIFPTGCSFNTAANANNWLAWTYDGTNWQPVPGSCSVLPTAALTTNTLPKASGTNTLTDSGVSDNGSTVSTSEALSAGAITGTSLKATNLSSGGSQCVHADTTGALGITGTDCGSANPAAPNNSLQKNNGGVFGASNLTEAGTTLTIGDDQVSCGANPWYDIRCAGAVAVNTSVAPFIPGITATINSGSPNATLSAASTFVNGQGVAIIGAGAPHALSTPAAPTVTSSLAAAPTGSGYVVNGAAGGAETTCYRLVARTKGGGLTAASAETCVTGQTRGTTTTSLNNCVRSQGNVVTCTTNSPHTLATGAWVKINGTNNDPEYAGYFILTSVPDNTHFVFKYDRWTGAGATSIAATGGNATYWQGNHIVIESQAPPAGAWQYGIYRGSTNAETFADVSMVVTPGVNQDSSYMVWDDFGTTYTTVPTSIPSIWPSAYPTSATSDTLVTTIASGAGTTSLVLAGNAGTSVAGNTILTDNSPNYIAAFTNAASVKATVIVPSVASGSFGTNSILDISSFAATPLLPSDATFFGDTLVTNGNQLLGNTKPNLVTTTQFSIEALINVPCKAKPCIYTRGGVIRGLAINPQGTNTQGVFVAAGGIPTGLFEDVAFLGASAAGDFASVPLIMFAQGQAGAAAAGITFRNTFTKGTAQGVTPNIISKNYGELNFDGVMQGGRGVMFSTCPTCTITGINWNQKFENQGPAMPLFVTRGTIGIALSGVIEDTGSQPIIAHLGPGPLFAGGAWCSTV